MGKGIFASIPKRTNDIKEELTLDFSNMSPDVQDVNTLLQKLGEKFYPYWAGVFYDNGVESDVYPLDTTRSYYSSDGYYITNYALSRNKTDILISATGGGSVGVGVDEKVDVTDFNRLKVTVTIGSSIKTYEWDITSKVGYYYVSAIVTTTSDKYFLDLTLSNTKEKCHISGNVVGSTRVIEASVASWPLKVYVNKFWMEK